MRVLVAEDDPRIAEDLARVLRAANYLVDLAPEGEEAHFLGDTEDYDAVVLDLGLPVMDGATVLKRWRADGRNMPVLILTARGSWHDKVEGIDAGADDYLAKPFQMEELLARLRALIRRDRGHASAVLTAGPVTLDTRTARASVDGSPLQLTALEYRLLAYLMLNRGRVVPRLELIEHIYEQDFERESNTIEVLVGRLRRKLGVDVIKTRRGLGYSFDAP
jgi:two-component system, OmpR family, response regulator